MLPHDGNEIRAFKLFGLESCNEYDIAVAAAHRINRGECRLDNAAASVSLNCTAELFCGSNAETAAEAPVFGNIGDKLGRNSGFPPAVGVMKFCVLL